MFNTALKSTIRGMKWEMGVSAKTAAVTAALVLVLLMILKVPFIK
jgi:hypothetical protein